MKRVKLFPKIFLYTFLVMMFVTVLAHVPLYIFAPQMTLSTNNFLESGAIIESSMNTEALIKLAILKALPISLITWMLFAVFKSNYKTNSADFNSYGTNGKT